MASSKQPRGELGFTLIEILLAVAIFALMGLAANVLLSQMVDVNARTQAHAAELAELQRAVRMIERDSAQFVPRSVRDELGDRRVPLSGGVDWLVEFTRTGWRNPLEQARSNMQRVTYVVEDGALVRYYWPMLDRADDSAPLKQSLLTSIAAASVEFVNEKGESASFWPPTGSTGGTADGTGEAQLPKALLWRIQSQRYGEIDRLIELPQLPKVSSTTGDGDQNAGGGQNGETPQPPSDTESGGSPAPEPPPPSDLPDIGLPDTESGGADEG